MPVTRSYSVTTNHPEPIQLKGLTATMKINSKSIRAALILPHDFSLYVKWQKQHVPGSELGQIRDALEYHSFTAHRNTQLSGNKPRPLSGSEPHSATECGHTVHPGDKIITELCPVCEVAAHLAFMHAITVAWNKAGGPRLLLGAHVGKKSCAKPQNGWHMARLQFQKFLDMLAITALYEEDWEKKNPVQAPAARRTRCASVAIKLAHMESRYPARLSPPPPMAVVKAKPVRVVKRVTFAEEVQVKDKEGIFAASTIFTYGRPRALYYRNSPVHQPGIHACPPGSEYIDTSQTKLLPADVSNLKIYVTDDEDAFDTLKEQPHLYADTIGDHQGIVGLHRLKGEVFQFIHDDMAQDMKAQDELEDSVEEADRLDALIDEHDNLLDVIFLNGSNEEDEEAEGGAYEMGKEREGAIWTCLRESLL